MTIKGIDLNMRWNDYRRNFSDTLYLWNGSGLFVIAEGSGDNLLAEDWDAGYRDYWLTSWYGTENMDVAVGQWYETDYITEIDYTIKGVIDRIEYCDLPDGDWKVINPKLGEQLIEAFDDYCTAKLVIDSIISKLNTREV